MKLIFVFFITSFVLVETFILSPNFDKNVIPDEIRRMLEYREMIQRRFDLFGLSTEAPKDIVTYLNTYINLKLREIPGIAEYFVNIEYKIPPYRFFIMLSFACYHLQNTASLLLHFNRFTCTIFPIYHQEFWKRGAFPLICLLTIYSFAAVWPVPLVNGYYIEVNGVVARSASMYTQLAGLYVYMDYGGKMYIGLAIFFNGATAAKLLYLRFRGQKLSNTQEIGLFVMAFATFFCQIFCQYVI
ncbi:unnamed protein product, partial [Mesorhabditis belari]|uniref:Serpentine receptor class gamma n=1 Tax=Mesorhabditis belari TaxID=2138241 RepID=A0AAF3F291_9BILA